MGFTDEGDEGEEEDEEADAEAEVWGREEETYRRMGRRGGGEAHAEEDAGEDVDAAGVWGENKKGQGGVRGGCDKGG